jgi:2-keto-3-deoxy-L-rhamnonate aldolase RhmA
MPVENAVKRAAKSGERVRGVHLTFPNHTAIEVLAGPLKLDFVYLDGEHGAFDARDLEIGCITAELHGLTTIARVPDRSSATILRFLDRGVQGIIVPHIESVAQAQEAVASTYYRPLGDRSFGGNRPSFLAIEDKPGHMLRCNANTSLCLMIESQAGIDAAGDLAAVEGVDYLSFGYMDLAQDMGHPGEPAHPAVKAAAADATARIQKAGKRVREDFMNYAWINEIMLAGAKQLLGS